MTFDSNMKLVEQDGIPEFYQIQGAGYEWRHTSYKNDLTFAGKLYKSATIKRSGFSSSRQIGSSKVTFAFPVADPLQKYMSAYPTPRTLVTIYRAVSSNLSQYALLFDGKVKRTSTKDKIISAECEMDDELSTLLPHIVYQSYCNWSLFDCNCGLDETSWDTTAIVTVDASSLISSTFATYATGWFTQGKVQFGGDFRFITNHEGSRIDLQLPFGPELINGSTVTAFPGCDGAPATCKAKFDNFSTRHVSMPYIPSHNPVIWGFK